MQYLYLYSTERHDGVRVHWIGTLVPFVKTHTANRARSQTGAGTSVWFVCVLGRDVNKAGSFKAKAKAKSLKAKAKARSLKAKTKAKARDQG